MQAFWRIWKNSQWSLCQFQIKELVLTRTRRETDVSSCIFLLSDGCNNLLAACQKGFADAGLRVSFASAQILCQLNWHFLRRKGMLNGSDLAAIDPVFFFISAFIDRVTRCGDNLAFTTVHTFSQSMSVRISRRNFFLTKWFLQRLSWIKTLHGLKLW